MYSPPTKQLQYLTVIFPVVAVIFVVAFTLNHHYHTYVWFSKDLPSPEEVASWDKNKLFNNLYKLSRWDGFVSGTQYNEFVRDQIDGLGLQNDTKFHFLEVGVGVGAFALEILKMYPNADGVGIDVVPGAIAIAEVVLPKERMYVRVGNMLDIEYGASVFDVVFVPGALCYLLSMDDVKIAVSEFHRVLKPNGRICLSMIASGTSEMGSCNTRIPKAFWTDDAVTKHGFEILQIDRMDDWNLPHSLGRYSICLRKDNHS
jgi:ubiquinone/menaquinone biosynthesis C-methylase UbiE